MGAPRGQISISLQMTSREDLQQTEVAARYSLHNILILQAAYLIFIIYISC
jgi:hypothetical protein